MSGAVRATATGVRLDVEVRAGARDDRFPDGADPWRGRLRARVRAPPERGAANAALCRLVAAFFRVPAAAVRVGRGAASTRKTILVDGLTAADAERRLAAPPRAGGEAP